MRLWLYRAVPQEIQTAAASHTADEQYSPALAGAWCEAAHLIEL